MDINTVGVFSVGEIGAAGLDSSFQESPSRGRHQTASAQPDSASEAVHPQPGGGAAALT